MDYGVTTDMVVTYDAFADEVSHAAGLLYAAYIDAERTGQGAWADRLGAAVAQVWQDNTDVTYEDIPAHREALRALVEALL